MALFIVRHQHDPDHCPATDPDLGAMLLNYLSRPNVRRHGVTIQGEAVVQGEHKLYMIVESSDADRVRAFMAPFARAGTVDVYPASTCARIVASGGCAAPMPVVDDVVPALDPEDACQHAIDSGLVVHRAHPLNCETSVAALIGGVVMPNAHFYVRNHFQIPNLDPTTWRLRVRGLVDRPLELSLRELTTMPSRTTVVTLECAGNGRSGLEPRVPGEQWELGAVSTAEWTGVPLVEVLDRAGIRAGAREVVFRGADAGPLADRPATIRFVRSWYAVTAVKWLTEIEVIDRAFSGHYQSETYFFEWERDGQLVREPVTLQRVRALITEPQNDDEIAAGELAIRGVAWSGAAPIARIEVSVDGGPWQHARLLGERSRRSWQWWELIARIDRPGTTTIRVRATDLAGRAQPLDPEWNRLGYGNNAVQEISVRIRS